MITRCRYLSTVKNIAHCPYKEEARRRAVENEKWNTLHGKYILTEYVEPDCPDDALRNEKGQNVCWIAECPVCGLNVVEEEPYDNYCMRCGQRIDWSEQE